MFAQSRQLKAVCYWISNPTARCCIIRPCLSTMRAITLSVSSRDLHPPYPVTRLSQIVISVSCRQPSREIKIHPPNFPPHLIVCPRDIQQLFLPSMMGKRGQKANDHIRKLYIYILFNAFLLRLVMMMMKRRGTSFSSDGILFPGQESVKKVDSRDGNRRALCCRVMYKDKGRVVMLLGLRWGGDEVSRGQFGPSVNVGKPI